MVMFNTFIEFTLLWYQRIFICISKNFSKQNYVIPVTVFVIQAPAAQSMFKYDPVDLSKPR